MALLKRESEIHGILLTLGITNQLLEKSQNNHYIIKSDLLNRAVFTSSTVSDHRSNANLKSEIKGCMITPPVVEMNVKFNPLNSVHFDQKEEIEFLETLASDTKEMIIARLLDGEHVSELAREFELISLKTLYKWKSNYQKKKVNGVPKVKLKVIESIVKSAKTIEDISEVNIDQALNTFNSFSNIISNQRKALLENNILIDRQEKEIAELKDNINQMEYNYLLKSRQMS